jgi:hypothetical protein
MDEVFRILDEAMERVRSLSRELAPREAAVGGKPVTGLASNPQTAPQDRSCYSNKRVYNCFLTKRPWFDLSRCACHHAN